MVRIAHVSDLHVLSPTGVRLREVLFDKRLTGYANLLSKRGRVYRHEHLEAVLAAAAGEADCVVVTGDVTNLSLESEYEAATRLFDAMARRTELVVVPGNHDVYLPSIHHERRFPHHFARFLRSDLPELGLDLPAGPFPTVRLIGRAAIIGLSSAVPRPPFVSAGFVGQAQLAALGRVLEHPEVVQRTAVVAVHHSPFDARYRLEQLRGWLVDARALRRALAPLHQGLLLYGHHHLRSLAPLHTATGSLLALSATAAPLEHADERVRAGYNLIEIDEQGELRSIVGRVLERSGRVFHSVPMLGPRSAA